MFGMTLGEELEPSFSLVDVAVSIHDENVWSHITWVCCAKRDQDMRGVKREQCLKVDLSGQLKITPALNAPHADLATDLKVPMPWFEGVLHWIKHSS